MGNKSFETKKEAYKKSLDRLTSMIGTRIHLGRRTDHETASVHGQTLREDVAAHGAAPKVSMSVHLCDFPG